MNLNNELDSTTESVNAHVVVVDVPASLTTEEATRLMNEPYDRGYYIHRAMEHNGGARVVYVSQTKPVARTLTASKEALAMQFLRDNREMSIQQLVAAFKALGFVRSAKWITEKRADVIKTERRLV